MVRCIKNIQKLVSKTRFQDPSPDISTISELKTLRFCHLRVVLLHPATKWRKKIWMSKQHTSRMTKMPIYPDSNSGFGYTYIYTIFFTWFSRVWAGPPSPPDTQYCCSQVPGLFTEIFPEQTLRKMKHLPPSNEIRKSKSTRMAAINEIFNPFLKLQ